MIHNHNSLPPIDPEHSVKLDVHTWSEHKEVNALRDAVWSEIPTQLQDALLGKSNNKGTPPQRILKVLLIHLYVTWLDDPTLCTGVARSDGAWAPNSRYNAIRIPKKINTLIDQLVELGFLDFIGGKNDRKWGGKYSRTSRIRPTPKLTALFLNCTATIFDFHKHKDTETIILNEFDTDREGNVIKTGRKRKKKKTKQVPYRDDKSTKQMRETVKAYNNLLLNTYVDVSSLEQPFVMRERNDGTHIKVQINQQAKFVRRVFSRGNWKCNGRWYGGFWQLIGEEYRYDIRIDDQPTIEVDYKGLHPSILAARKGYYFSGDRYNLGEHLIPHITPKQQRDAVKLLVLTAINATTRTQAYQAHVDAAEIKLKHTELELLLNSFLANNPYLREDVCADQGVDLMYLDSQITEQIITSFLQEEKPILCIHDSYVVQIHDTEFLHQQMQHATEKVLGSKLPFDQDMYSYNQLRTFLDDDLNTTPPQDLFELIPTPKRTDRYLKTLRKFVAWQSKNNPNKTYNLSHLND